MASSLGEEKLGCGTSATGTAIPSTYSVGVRIPLSSTSPGRNYAGA
jgi:hypothetical protein